MILSDGTLRRMLHQFITEDADSTLINPASIDIRIGRRLLYEDGDAWTQIELVKYREGCYQLQPGEFVLVETLERLTVPNGYAIELKLKSSRAREGYNHSMAFWFDPGWDGIGTMEIHNVSRVRTLPLFTGLRFAQIIIHQLDAPAVTPYQGRYHNAIRVEASKG